MFVIIKQFSLLQKGHFYPVILQCFEFYRIDILIEGRQKSRGECMFNNRNKEANAFKSFCSASLRRRHR